jgi:hypothetical protein
LSYQIGEAKEALTGFKSEGTREEPRTLKICPRIRAKNFPGRAERLSKRVRRQTVSMVISLILSKNFTVFKITRLPGLYRAR